MVKWAGISADPPAAMSAYHGSPPTLMNTRATRVSEMKESYESETAKVLVAPMSAPATPARKAAMANTRIRSMLTLVPFVESATGESTIAAIDDRHETY